MAPGIGNKMWHRIGRRRKLVDGLSKPGSATPESLSAQASEDSVVGDGDTPEATDTGAAPAEDSVALALWGDDITDSALSDGTPSLTASSNDQLPPALHSSTVSEESEPGELAAAAAAAGAARAAAAAAAADPAASAKVSAAKPKKPPRKRLFDRVWRVKGAASARSDSEGEEAQTVAARPAAEESVEPKAELSSLQKLMVDIETELVEIEKKEALSPPRAKKKPRRDDCFCLVWMVDSYVVVDHVLEGVFRQRA